MTQTARPSRGFTLIELLLALAVSVIVLGAVQSIVMVASKSVPIEGRGPFGAVRASVALEQLGADLETATLVLFADSRQLEFLVPDNDSDGSPDAVRYSWSGISGDPLIRQYRGNTLATWDTRQVVVNRVQWMEFAHDRADPIVVKPEILPETLLASFEPVSGRSTTTITSGSSVAQSFRVTLPSTAVSYKITRVAFRASQAGTAAGSTSVTISQSLSQGLPASTSLGSASVSELLLAPTLQWMEVAIPGLPLLTPGSDLTLALRQTGGSASAEVESGDTAQTLLSGLRSISVDGLNFSPASSAMAYRIYGVFTTTSQTLPEAAPRYVGCTVRFGAVGGGSGGLTELTFVAPNRPQAP